MQNVAVRIGLGTRGHPFGAQELGHHPGDFRTANVAPHGLRAGYPVVAAGALHGVEALVDEHYHGKAVVGLDGCSIYLMGVPGIGRDLADADEIRTQVVAERLQRPGVGARVPKPRGVIRYLSILERHHAPDELHGSRRGGMLVGETLDLALGLLPEVAKGRPRKEVRPLRDTGNLFVHDQRGRTLYPADLLHRVAA